MKIILLRLFLLFTSFCFFIALRTESYGRSVASAEKTFSSRLKADVNFIVWNVGQGLWTTMVTERICFHFDSGGEYAPLKQIKTVCGNKVNAFHFSHWDWDHIGLIFKARKILSQVCIEALPLGPHSKKKELLLRQTPLCKKDLFRCPAVSRKVLYSEKDWSKLNKKARRSTKQPASNSSSRVYILNEQILLPGDSTSRAEKVWSQKIKSRRVRIHVLGHHGSKTSTSTALLHAVPNAKLAIASARFARYGHPHPKIKKRLNERGVSVISTEIWGSLIFPRPSESTRVCEVVNDLRARR